MTKEKQNRRGIDPCITPNCERVIHSRGLCRSHYNTAHKLMSDGQCTESKLLKAGKILPPTTRYGTSKFLKGVC